MVDFVDRASEIYREIWSEPKRMAEMTNQLNGLIKKMSLEEESEYYDRIETIRNEACNG